MGFAIVWHIWWLAAASLVFIIICIITRLTDEHTEYTVTAAEIAKLEAKRKVREISHIALPSQVGNHDNKTNLGFWVYLMTDTILFATLFATYAVLKNSTNGGPSGHDIFDMPYTLVETFLLLLSSFTCGLAVIALQRRRMAWVGTLLGITFALGLAFVTLELTEFTHLVAEGNGWQRNAFLSSFFTLVGTHGLHISFGLLWLGVLGVRLVRNGFTSSTTRQLTLFSLFWHFLDVVWVFIFTIVYLMGAS